MSWLVDQIVYAISYGIFRLFFFVCVSLPFMLLSAIFGLMKFLGFDFLNYILFGSNIKDFSISQIPTLFISFGVLCSIMAVLLITFVFFRAMKNGDFSIFKKGLKNTGLMFLLVFGLPFIILIFNLIMLLLTQTLQYLAGIGIAEEFKNDPAAILFFSTFKSNLTTNGAHSIIANGYYWNLDWDFFKAHHGSSWETVPVGAIVAIGSLYLLIQVVFEIVEKTLLNFALFVYAPVSFSQSITDDGESMKKWRQIYTENTIKLFFLICTSSIYILFLTQTQILYEWIPNPAFSFILKLVIPIGCVFATIKITNLFLSLLGLEQIKRTNIKNMGSRITGSLGKVKDLALKGSNKIGLTKQISKLNAKTKAGFSGFITARSNKRIAMKETNLNKQRDKKQANIENKFANKKWLVNHNQKLEDIEKAELLEKEEYDSKFDKDITKMSKEEEREYWIGKYAIEDKYKALAEAENKSVAKKQARHDKKLMKKKDKIDSQIDNEIAIAKARNTRRNQINDARQNVHKSFQKPQIIEHKGDKKVEKINKKINSM